MTAAFCVNTNYRSSSSAVNAELTLIESVVKPGMSKNLSLFDRHSVFGCKRNVFVWEEHSRRVSDAWRFTKTSGSPKQFKYVKTEGVRSRKSQPINLWNSSLATPD